MGGIFGGAGGTPPAAGGMTGFDANAVAQALLAAQGGGGGGGAGAVTGGSKIGNVNPLAQMLAAQGPAYQPGGGPTPQGWGMAGDRLARYTPQGGVIPIAPGSANVPPIYTGAPPSTIAGGGAGGGRPTPGGPSGPAGPAGTPTPSGPGGGGGYPPINPGEDSMAYMLRIGMSQADAEAALAMSKANPGMSFQDIMAARKVGGGGTTAPTQPYINWGQLGAQLDSSGTPVPVPKTSPTGAPAINAAMEQLKTPTTAQFDDQGRYTGPVPTTAEMAQYRAARDAAAVKPEGFQSLPKAQKDAWYQNWLAARNAYVEMEKRTGYGPGGYTIA